MTAPRLLLLLLCLFAASGCRSSLAELWSNSASDPAVPLPDAPKSPRRPASKLSREDSIAQNLARAHGEFSLGRIAAARQMYRKVLAEDPGNPVAHHRLAILADGEQSFTLAEAHYLASLNREPRNSNVLSDLGYSYFQQGRREEAALRLTEAIKHDPTNLHALKNMAAVEEARGNRQAVAELHRQIAEIPPRPAGPLTASRLSGGHSRPMSSSAEPLHAPDPLVDTSPGQNHTGDVAARGGQETREESGPGAAGVADPTRRLKELMDQKRREALASRQQKNRLEHREEATLRERRLREIQLAGGEEGSIAEPEVSHAGGIDQGAGGRRDSRRDRKRHDDSRGNRGQAAASTRSDLRHTPDHRLRDVLAEIDRDGEPPQASSTGAPKIIVVDPPRGRAGVDYGNSRPNHASRRGDHRDAAHEAEDIAATSRPRRDDERDHSASHGNVGVERRGTRAAYGPANPQALDRPWNEQAGYDRDGDDRQDHLQSVQYSDMAQPQLGPAHSRVPNDLTVDSRSTTRAGGESARRASSRPFWPAEVPETLRSPAAGRFDDPRAASGPRDHSAQAAARAALIGGMNAGPGGMFPMTPPRRDGGGSAVASQQPGGPATDYVNGGPTPIHSPGEGLQLNGTAYPRAGRYDNEEAIRDWHDASGAPADPVGRPSRYARDPVGPNRPWAQNDLDAPAARSGRYALEPGGEDGYGRQRAAQDRLLRDQQRALHADRQLPPSNGERLPPSGHFVNPRDYDHRMINAAGSAPPHDPGRRRVGEGAEGGERWNSEFDGAPQSPDQVRREGRMQGTPYRQPYWNERSDAGPTGRDVPARHAPGDGPEAHSLDTPRVNSRY